MHPYLLAVLADQRIAELRAEQRSVRAGRPGRTLRTTLGLTTAARGALTAGISAARPHGRAAARRRAA